MIEFCSRKRMVIVIISLVTVSVVSLGIETRWSTQQRIKGVQRKGRKDAVNETCKSGKESIVESCSECSAPELVKKAKFCEETGFREIVACEDGTKISRQCTVTPWMEEKKFWMFEGVTLVIGVLAYGMVVIRQHKLDQMLKEKIDRQIAAGI